MDQSPLPNGTEVYAQNILDVANDTAVHRNVYFYVTDPTGTEESFYKDNIPVSTLKTDQNIFLTEVREELISMFPNQGFSIVAADYKTLSGVVRTYIPNEPDTGKDVIVGFTFEQNPTTKVLTTRQLDETSDIIMQMGG